MTGLLHRVVALTAVGLVASLAATACSDPGSGTAAPSATDISWPEPTADLQGTTLTIWAAQNSNTVPKQVIADFEQATGATVDVVTVPDPYEQDLQTKVASGDKPDLAFWQPTESQLTALNAKENLQDLGGAPFLDSYKPELKDVTGSLDGTRYAALISTPAVMGVWYNKEVLARDGITSTPTSFDELVADAQKIKAAGDTPFFEMGKDQWATQWWVQVLLADAAKNGLWDKVNSNQEQFTSADVEGAISTYQGLVQQGLFNSDITSATFEDQGEAILSGKAAMAMQVNTFFSQLQAKTDTATLNEKIGFFPISPSGNVGTFIPDQSNALVAFKTGDAKREAAARQLLAFWLSTPEYTKFVAQQNTVSILKDVETPTTVPTALTDNAASIGDSVGSMQVSAIVNPDLYINLANMLAGQATPQEVASTTQDQFTQLAQAIGAPGF